MTKTKQSRSVDTPVADKATSGATKKIRAKKTAARRRPGSARQPPSGAGKSPLETGAPGAKAGAAPGFPIVGIGASAGGLESLEAFFKAMPADAGIGLVLVVHLDPTHVSILPELLQKHTTMPVYQIEDGMPVERDHVYVIPPNKSLAILHGTLQLMDLAKPRGSGLPIDAFLRALARDQERNAVCIILSGTGTDGTLGVKAIKGEAGMVMVQSEESAKYDGMPRSAIATGLADYVLQPGKMPDQLLRYIRHARQRAVTGIAPGAGPTPDALQKIFLVLRARTDHDFSQYKINTICRRIERRMNVHQIDDIADYARYLQESEREAGILFKELLIGVTNFFRDPEAFESLKRKILPNLLAGKPDDSTIRVWVPGCASGEEAYSLAIVLHECIEQIGRYLNVQTFATDLDEDAIDVARAGLYSESILGDVGAERIKRYFTREEDGRYRVKTLIREMIVFAPQNVIKDPPFTKLDLLCCRNLLIYLEPDLQRRLLPIFYYSLRPDGVLFLGSSETIGSDTELFALADKKWKIFRRKAGVGLGHPVLDVRTQPETYRARGHEIPEAEKEAEGFSVLQLVETILQLSDIPPCAIIDDACNTVYVHGRTGRFLEPAEGVASVNIMEMARPELRQGLGAAIRQVSRHREVVSRNLQLDYDGGTKSLNLTVKPVLETTAIRGLMMVVFEETAAPLKARRSGRKPTAAARGGKSVEELERELQHTREGLQTTIEELETSNEELKSTNEELQSTNEELQSTNEELETSKEELQSLNEESATVNAELQSRIDDWSKANDDMQNLLDATEIATVFLDTQQRVRRFTPKATEIFPLTAVDCGRPIKHLVSTLAHVDIAESGEQVLKTLVAQEVEVSSEDGRNYVMRVRPYRTASNVIDGVVVTFQETTELKRKEHALSESERRYRMLFELASDSIALIDPHTGRFVECNQRAYEHLGYTREEFATLTVADIEVAQSADRIAAHLDLVADGGSDMFETKHRTKDGEARDVQVKMKTVSHRERTFLLSTWHDIVPADTGGKASR